MPWSDAHGYTPLSSPAILPAFIWQKSTSLLCLAWTLSSSAFRNFSHLHKCTPIKTVRCCNPSPALTTTPSKPLSLYKCWNIHMHTYFPSTFLTTFFLKRTFFCTLSSAIFMRAGGVPMANTVTHPQVLHWWGDKLGSEEHRGAILLHSSWERRSVFLESGSSAVVFTSLQQSAKKEVLKLFCEVETWQYFPF